MARETLEELKVREARMRFQMDMNDISLKRTLSKHPLATTGVALLAVIGLRKLPALSRNAAGIRLLTSLLRLGH